MLCLLYRILFQPLKIRKIKLSELGVIRGLNYSSQKEGLNK